MKPSIQMIGLLAVAGVVATAQADFRVTPYLLNPSDSGVSLTWFTEDSLDSTLTVSDGDLLEPLTFSITPELMENLSYTAAEFEQSANLGYPMFQDSNYKHFVDLNGLLSADTQYTYTVSQGTNIYGNSFSTAPAADDWSSISFTVHSDSETEPRGNTNKRDWALGTQAPGSLGRPSTLPEDSRGRDLYLMTETDGYANNLVHMHSLNPDFVVMPGDLVQGGGYQFGWDEFFRHNAGSYDDHLGSTALLPALGNWENFGALNGGYAPEAVQNARGKFKTYFDLPSNGTPEHQNQYYRTDYGPITIITLDSSDGQPHNTAADTQNNVDPATYPGDDLADFNPGSAQYAWAMAQLADARENGQIVFVQFHHTPYSSGVHGFPIGDPRTSGQGGVAMRVYAEMFDDYGVAAILSGHSEIAEKSFIDPDGDGAGFYNFDTGVAGDGMRGTHPDPNNPFSEWTAHLDSGEMWGLNDDGEVVLLDGGKHYGFVGVEVDNLGDGTAKVEYSYYYSFPLIDFDDDGNLVILGTELREYEGGGATQMIGVDGAVVPEPSTIALLVAGLGAIFFILRRRRA